MQKYMWLADTAGQVQKQLRLVSLCTVADPLLVLLPSQQSPC